MLENNIYLLEILAKYELLISYRARLLDIDTSVTQVDLYRTWVESEIVVMLTLLHKLCWDVVSGKASLVDSDE